MPVNMNASRPAPTSLPAGNTRGNAGGPGAERPMEKPADSRSAKSTAGQPTPDGFQGNHVPAKESSGSSGNKTMLAATLLPTVADAGGMIAQSIQERSQGPHMPQRGTQEGQEGQPGQPGSNGHSPAETAQGTRTDSSNQAFTSGMRGATQSHLDGISARF